MAFTYAYTGVGSPSSVMRSDDVEFPQDPGLAIYQQWEADGGDGITAAAPSPAIEDLIDVAKVEVNRRAGDARRVFTHAGVPEDLGNGLRFKEAMDYEALGGVGSYPLLEAEVPGNGATVDAVHDNVLTELAALKDELAAIEVIRREAFDDLDGCANQAAIDAVLAALDFSP